MTSDPRPRAIEVRGLSKSFRAMAGLRDLAGARRRITALDGIDLDVRRGEIFGLLGPNGAGKTTLVKVLAGLVLADAGTVRVDGHDPASAADALHRTIGVVYGDERTFQWRIGVRDNLRFFARLYGMSRRDADRRIDDLLDLVGLTHAEDRRMLAFSSGMRQRAAIARGLLHDPRVVVMDEPTRMLDPVGAHDIHALVRDQVADGERTVVLATNTMSEAEALCDRVVLIREGRSVLAGPIEDLRAVVSPHLTYRLDIGGPRRIARSLGSVAGVESVEVVGLAGDTSSVRVVMHRSTVALPAVIRAILGQGGEVVGCNREEVSLDQIFRDVVRGGDEEVRVGA